MTARQPMRYSPLAKRNYAAGARNAVRIAVRARGLTLTEEQSAQVDACEDAATLEKWLEAAATATDATDIFR